VRLINDYPRPICPIASQLGCPLYITLYLTSVSHFEVGSGQVAPLTCHTPATILA